jgi:LPXTG-motif cell wall-anchored protein
MLALVLALALPAAAVAQSAGDNQYRDPFASQPQSAPAKGGGNSGSGNSGSQGSGSQSGAGSNATARSGSSQSQSVNSVELPRTGIDAETVALAGALLLLGGFGLRRVIGSIAARRERHAPLVLGRDVRVAPVVRRGR